jgi:uncharacterized protein YjdB
LIENGVSPVLEKGKTIVLKDWVTLAPKTEQNVWTSSNPSIATVDIRGIVKAVSTGSVRISHVNTVSNENTDFDLECVIPIGKIKIEKLTKDESRSLLAEVGGTLGSTLQLRTTVAPSDATDQTLYWESSNEDIMTVDDNGLVTVVGFGKKGSAKMTARDVTGKKKASMDFIVSVNSN